MTINELIRYLRNYDGNLEIVINVLGDDVGIWQIEQTNIQQKYHYEGDNKVDHVEIIATV